MADLLAHSIDATAQADDRKILPSKKALAKAERAAKKERAKAERAALRAKAKEERKQSKSLAKMAEAKILKDLALLSKHIHVPRLSPVVALSPSSRQSMKPPGRPAKSRLKRETQQSTPKPTPKIQSSHQPRSPTSRSDLVPVVKATRSSSTKMARLGKTSRISS
jgi:hypothetical protein